MSLPNCCSVVRKRFSLLSCRAPQVAGSCWLASDEEEEEDGPLLYRCGGDGTAFRVGGEWWFPLVTGEERWDKEERNKDGLWLTVLKYTLTPPTALVSEHNSGENYVSKRMRIQAFGLHAVVEKEAGRGPLGLTEGRGGMVELALLLGADLEWVLASTGEPGMAGLFFSLLSAGRVREKSFKKH